MNKWKIQGSLYDFPDSWVKDDVMNWVNTDIKVCPDCGKIDAGISHFKDCSIEREQQNSYYNYKQ